MLGTAGNLATLPDFQIFVPLVLAIHVALFFLAERFIKSPRWKKLTEIGSGSLLILFCMIWSAHNASKTILLDKSTDFRSLGGDIEIRLFDIRSLEGWGEGDSDVGQGRERLVHGDHNSNRGQPQSVRIFDQILRQINRTQEHGADLQRMTQDQWVAFLRDLNNDQRRAIGRIPFAILIIRLGDDSTREIVMFRNERYTIRGPAGEVVGRLCLDRIFNTPDIVSGEREAVVISYGGSHCGSG